MYFLIICTGIVIGILLAIITFLATRKYTVPIERTINQIDNKLKQKGEIYIEEDDKRELENYIDTLPRE